MKEKKCFKCGLIKHLEDFYRHPEMTDGHLNKCKECANRDARKNRRDKVDYYRSYDRARGNRQGIDYLRKYMSENPEKYKARYTLNNALRDGKIQKHPCEICGSTENLEAHHDGYSKPLDVIWLCSMHHSWIHG